MQAVEVTKQMKGSTSSAMESMCKLICFIDVLYIGLCWEVFYFYQINPCSFCAHISQAAVWQFSNCRHIHKRSSLMDIFTHVHLMANITLFGHQLFDRTWTRDYWTLVIWPNSGGYQCALIQRGPVPAQGLRADHSQPKTGMLHGPRPLGQGTVVL